MRKANVVDDGSQFEVQGLDAAMIDTMAPNLSISALIEDCGRHGLVRAWVFRSERPRRQHLGRWSIANEGYASA
jgi:hypothetical protein